MAFRLPHRCRAKPAAAVVVNPNTVAEAYRELERSGLVTPRAGQGTFVSGLVGEVPAAAYAELSHGLRGWLRSARAAGLDQDQIAALVTATLDDEARAA